MKITEAKWNSKGTIPLDPTSLRIIRHYVRNARPQIRNSSVMRQLFLTKTGSPYNSNKMTKKMRMLLKRYGFTNKSAHSMRHHFCTDLLNVALSFMKSKHSCDTKMFGARWSIAMQQLTIYVPQSTGGLDDDLVSCENCNLVCDGCLDRRRLR